MITMELLEQKAHAKKPVLVRVKVSSAERLLWAGLRSKLLRRYNFRRRFGFGVFILDFYCQKSRLAVEIVREDQVRVRQNEYSRRRRQYIELYDIAIIQFTAIEVSTHLNAVLAKINEVARKRSGPRSEPLYTRALLPHLPDEQIVVSIGS